MPRIICIGILFTLLSACGNGRGLPQADLDAAYPAESVASAIASRIFNSLLKYDRNLELEGELAQSWEISKDQKTITFRLKPELKWADGTPLTSADVLFTWQLVTDDKTDRKST